MDEEYFSNKRLKDKLKMLFETSKTQTGYQNLVEAAKKLYNKQNDSGMFLTEFVDVLKYCLVYPDKAAADKMLLFTSKFAASLYSHKALIHDSDDPEEDMEHPFVNGLFEFLFQIHGASSVDVRLRCTTLINYILAAMPDDSWLPVSIWNGLSQTTRSRLQDRNTNVRVAAVLVARKLQEPKDPKCEIVKLLTFHITDPSPAVRRAVVSSIALSKVTIVDVLGRTLDVNENVRRNAFVAISKVRFQSLTIAQRITLLERGLKDRAERVRSCVETVLVGQWLDQVGNDVLTLMKGLDVVNCCQVNELMLDAITKLLPIENLVKALPLDAESRIIPVQQLTPENALLWRFLSQHLSKNDVDDMLEIILPTVSSFTDLVKRWYPLDGPQPDVSSSDEQWAEVQRKQVLLHLLQMAHSFDLSDEMGRSNLIKLAMSLLTSSRIESQLVPNLVELLHVAAPKTDDFLAILMEAISDIREPLNQIVVERPHEEILKMELEVTGYKVTLNDLREREYEAVQSKNYAEAAILNAEIEEVMNKIKELNVQPASTLCEVREEKNDPETMCKCLSILVKMIPMSGMEELTPELRTLRDDFLQPCLRSQDLLTQSLAVQVLAQLCILDKSLAQDHLLGFLFMLSEYGENEVNTPALKAIFDILQTHGMQCIQELDNAPPSESPKRTENADHSEDEVNCSQGENSELSKPAAKCIAVLRELLSCSANDELKSTAFEGFCKLLATGVVYSPSLLKTVIIKGFTPIRGNEAEDRIRQIFMVFFPLFSRNTPRSQEMIEAAFIPVMRVLGDSQIGSPEADISPRDVATFLIDHTKPGINKFTSSAIHVHNTLALSICHEILRDVALSEDLGHDLVYLRGLLQLNLALDSEAFVRQMLTLLAKIKREIRDSACLRMLKQLQTTLMQRLGSSSSVQNTFESIQRDSVNRSFAESDANRNSTTSEPRILESVPETSEELNIQDNSTSSEPTKRFSTAASPLPAFIAESPEVTDGSDCSE